MTKKLILLFVFFVICTTVYSQIDTVKVNQLDSAGNKTGLWITYHDTLTHKNVKAKINYEKGRKCGVAEFYDVKGKLSSMHTYVNDTLDGRKIIYAADSIQHYYIYSKGEKVWYGVVENGIMGYSIIYIDGIARYNFIITEDGKFHGIGTSNKKIKKEQ